jgi:hypothetical protein
MQRTRMAQPSHCRLVVALAGSCILAALLLAGPAHATGFVQFDVPRQGGAYTVYVLPGALTLLRFPAEVLVAYTAQRHPPPFDVEQHQQEVTVIPKTGTRDGSVIVATRRFRVAVHLRVTDDPARAANLVEFRDRELEETFEARVAQEAQHELDRRWSEARAEMQRDLAAIERGKAELAEKQQHLQTLIRQATMQGVADGIRARRRSVAMGGMAREQHVLVRIEGIEWVGSDGYVVFSIQNRRTTPYQLGEVVLRLGGLARTDAVSFPRPANAGESGVIGLIPPGDRLTGVIALGDAANWMGERVSLELTEHGAPESSTRGTITISFWIHE